MSTTPRTVPTVSERLGTGAGLVRSARQYSLFRAPTPPPAKIHSPPCTPKLLYTS